MMNGQSALKEMMEEEMKKQEKEREKDYLLKWDGSDILIYIWMGIKGEMLSLAMFFR